MARPILPVLAAIFLATAGLPATSAAAPSEVLSGTVVPLLAAPVSAAAFLERARQPIVAASAYVPRTAHDNSPYRFNMTQNGRRMTADEFEAWMRARGIRVATGRPTAAPAAAPAPTATAATPACAPTVAVTC